MYTIRAVDAEDDEIRQTLVDLHRSTFLDSAALPQFDHGSWWLAYRRHEPVAFAGVVPSTCEKNSGYFCRVGVTENHWGHSLQLRLMRAIEAKAALIGWSNIVSDTTDNRISANNFIKAGYLLFDPEMPWGWTNTLYWRKPLRKPR
jgi:acetyltransferase (GNAT) family protein